MKYHVPTRFGFSPKASGFYPFGDAIALPSEGGGIAKRKKPLAFGEKPNPVGT
ncbi:MAG: hypothetical protein SPE55_06685 [Sodaliphilus sp.]|nr:hypothetical protein [Sodaliphilus sp.]